MLTLEDINNKSPGIFRTGIEQIHNPMTNDLVLVKFVAVRGEINDWAIYHSLSSNFTGVLGLDDKDTYILPDGLIEKLGDKLRNVEDIKKLVPCDDEAFKQYRF